MYKYLKRGNEEEGANLYSVEPTDRTRGNSCKLKHEVQSDHAKHFFLFFLGWLVLWLFFSLRILNSGTGCPEMLRNLHLWGYSRAVWTQSWVPGVGWIRWHLEVPSSFNHILILWKEILCYKLFDGLKTSFRFILGTHTKLCCWMTHFLCWITHSQNVGWSNFD